MKGNLFKMTVLVVAAILILTQSCNRKSKNEINYCKVQFELMGRDTINLMDRNCLKQGSWITSTLSPIKNGTLYIESDKQEGVYKDGKKYGVWKYYKNGILKNSICYKKDIVLS